MSTMPPFLSWVEYPFCIYHKSSCTHLKYVSSRCNPKSNSKDSSTWTRTQESLNSLPHHPTSSWQSLSGNIWRVYNLTTSFDSRMYAQSFRGVISAVTVLMIENFLCIYVGLFRHIHSKQVWIRSFFQVKTTTQCHKVPSVWLDVMCGRNPPSSNSPSLLLSDTDTPTSVTWDRCFTFNQNTIYVYGEFVHRIRFFLTHPIVSVNCPEGSRNVYLCVTHSQCLWDSSVVQNPWNSRWPPAQVSPSPTTTIVFETFTYFFFNP
jgi:hypothetical protein